MAAKLKILSLDGGGTRGIIPATILDCLFRDTNKHPTELFDLFAGTSTGGILSIGLTFGLPTAKLVDLYQKNAKEIFYDSGWDDFRDGFGKNLGADYSNKYLKKILLNTFGKTKLKDIDVKYNSKKQLMVTSFDVNPTDDLGNPVNFRPKIFNSGFIQDCEELLVDVALCTSSAPTYFPIYKKKYIDGGVALNHPAMAALAFAINDQINGKGKYLYPDGNRKGLALTPKDVKILSIGCGTTNRNSIPTTKIKGGDWGNLQWVKYLPDLLIESNVQVSEYYVNQVLPDGHYKRLQPAFDSNDTPAVLRNKDLGMDVKDAILLDAMKKFAEAFYQKNKKAIHEFLGL